MAFLRVFLSRLLTVFIVFAMVSTSFVTAANARFISPDDWDPVVQGVGTNRYSYADNDPINKSDPNGHAAAAVGGGGWLDSIGKAIGGLFSSIGRGFSARAGSVAAGAGSLATGGVTVIATIMVVATTKETGNGEMRGDAKENTQGIATPTAGAASPEPDDENKRKPGKTRHAEQRELEGRQTRLADQDLSNARRSDVFFDNNKRTLGVRGPKGREHYYNPESGEHVTTLGNIRTRSAFNNRMFRGDTRPATEQEFQHLRALRRGK